MRSRPRRHLDGNGRLRGPGRVRGERHRRLVLENVKARGNFADGGGGAGLAYNFTSASMVGIRALDNVTSGGSGGGLYAYVGARDRRGLQNFSGNQTSTATAAGST